MKERYLVLAIHKEPFYKNKAFLSSFTVLAGFVVTAGLLSVLSSGNNSVQQSVEPNKPSSSLLLPVTASKSESDSEDSSSAPNSSNEIEAATSSHSSPNKSTQSNRVSQSSKPQPDAPVTPAPAQTPSVPAQPAEPEQPTNPNAPILCRDNVLDIVIELLPLPITGGCPSTHTQV